MSEGKQGRCFIDTNIWLYAFLETQGSKKSTMARSVIREKDITISTQIINEVCVNLIKKVQFSEENIQKLIISFYEKYPVIEITKGILLKASELRGQNRLSFWDSVIVASALYSNIDVLYSEDMQDGFMGENKLRIVNPFQNT
jgi:predicted nucleic acid-binding protein